MSLKTQRDLFQLISELDIPKKEKDEYLKYLFTQNQLINQEYISKQNNPHDRGETIIGVKGPVKLKSFFEGNEGIKFIHNKNGCFEQEILPHLPDEYIPRNPLRAFKFEFKNWTMIVPDKPSEISFKNLVLTQTFSLNEMLSVFAEGIRETEKYFLSKEKKTVSTHEAVFSLIYKPTEPFFDVTGVHTYCSPREDNNSCKIFRFIMIQNKKHGESIITMVVIKHKTKELLIALFYFPIYVIPK